MYSIVYVKRQRDENAKTRKGQLLVNEEIDPKRLRFLNSLQNGQLGQPEKRLREKGTTK